MKESKVLVVTGKTVDEIRQSANSIINRLANEINELSNKLKSVSGETNKVSVNTLKIVSDKENVYLETATGNGKYSIKLERKG